MNEKKPIQRFTKLTPEYLGGILAGAGLGTILIGLFLFRGNIWNKMDEILIVGFILIPIGSGIALRHQRKKDNNSEQSVAGYRREATPQPDP